MVYCSYFEQLTFCVKDLQLSLEPNSKRETSAFLQVGELFIMNDWSNFVS